jgi:hypothetical protein
MQDCSTAADTIAGLIAAMGQSIRSSPACGPMASLVFLFFPLRRLITPFAGVGIVVGVVLQTLFGARFIGAAEFRAAVAHDGRRIRLTLRRQSS